MSKYELELENNKAENEISTTSETAVEQSDMNVPNNDFDGDIEPLPMPAR